MRAWATGPPRVASIPSNTAPWSGELARPKMVLLQPVETYSSSISRLTVDFSQEADSQGWIGLRLEFPGRHGAVTCRRCRGAGWRIGA